MYAVIETGGKQYKVAVGDKLKVEKLSVDQGASVELERVLMVADGEKIEVGSPIEKTTVSATVIEHGRGRKIRVFKMKRRKNYRRTQGHRQAYTEIEITAIAGKGAASKKVVAKKVVEKKVVAKKVAVKTEAAPKAARPKPSAAKKVQQKKSAAKKVRKSKTD